MNENIDDILSATLTKDEISKEYDKLLKKYIKLSKRYEKTNKMNDSLQKSTFIKNKSLIINNRNIQSIARNKILDTIKTQRNRKKEHSEYKNKMTDLIAIYTERLEIYEDTISQLELKLQTIAKGYSSALKQIDLQPEVKHHNKEDDYDDYMEKLLSK